MLRLPSGHSMTSGIYQFKCRRTGKRYVGRSKSCEARRLRHLSFLRRGVHESPHFQAAWKKYGEGAFSWSIIERLPPNNVVLKKAEQKHLDKLFASGKNLNVCPNASSVSGKKHTRLTRERIGRAHVGHKRLVGYKHTEKTRKNMACAATKAWARRKETIKKAKTIAGRHRRRMLISGVPFGKYAGKAKLNDDAVREIIELLRTERCATIAAKFNISPRTVRQILYGRTWRHIPRPYNYGDRNSIEGKITDAEVRDIRKKIARGYSFAQVARELGWDPSCVHRLASGRVRRGAGGPIYKSKR
jgi:group I intron endonuclease